MLSRILLLCLFIVSSDAKVNQYLQKGVDIVDIGNSNNVRYIEVPFTKVYYAPTMQVVNNVIIYSDRKVTSSDCVIDGLEHESCPLDKEECLGETEYTQGSSSRGEGYISCSQLNVNAYYDRERRKCVLPSSYAKVCRDYPGTTYDASRDLCVKDVTRALPEDLPEIFYNTWWSTGNSDPKGYGIHNNLIQLREGAGYSGKPSKPYHCGHDGSTPSSITVNERTCNRMSSGWEDVPCTEVNNVFGIKPGGGWGMINGCYCVEDDGAGNPMYTNPVNGKCRAYVRHGGDSDFCDGWSDDGNWQDYECPAVTNSCDSDEIFSTINDGRYCTKEVSYTPKCAGGFFPERNKAECVGERLKYDYFDYSCPDDKNVYDNAWNIVDPGGDCGEYSLSIDTNGDGVNDRCNSPSPTEQNCERTTYKCEINPDAICIIDEKEIDYNDFTKWEVSNPDGIAHDDCPNYSGGSWWVVDQEQKNSVWQKCNGNPTYFLSNYVLNDGHITMEGSFRTDDPTDNDFFGFVFGFKDRSNYKLLSWSRWKNDTWRGNHDTSDAFVEPLVDGEIPLALVDVKGYAGGNWHRVNYPGQYDVLQRANNGGWTTGQTYKIKLDITAHDIKVWIGKEGEPLKLDINYHSDTPMDITGKLGFYNYSISRVTYKDFKIEWQDGENITQTLKRPLVDPASLSGEYKPLEYGSLREGLCAENNNTCKYSLSSIEGSGNTLCFKDKSGQEGCFKATGTCLFDGVIDDFGIGKKPLLSFLNSPDEIIQGYHTGVEKDFDSPTNISLDFTSLPESNYLLEQVKTNANVGDKVTVDFWMYWRGGKGMPVGFKIYDLWITDYLGYFKFGFNTGMGDLYGIKDIDYLKNGWHRITAVFTHGDMLQNKLYINGVAQELSEQHHTRTEHNNDRADITHALQLSGWTANSRYSLDAKIAGFNVYDGELTSMQIDRLSKGGSLSGISRLRINKNTISGFDAGNIFLGEINSTCELSGKVGFFGKTIEVNETIVTNIDNKAFMLDGSNDSYLRIPNSRHISMLGISEMAVYLNIKLDGVPSTSADILFNKEGQYELAVNQDGIIKFAMMTENQGWTWHTTSLKVPQGVFVDILFNYDGAHVTISVEDAQWSIPYTGKIIQYEGHSASELRIGDREALSGAYTLKSTVGDFKLYRKSLSVEDKNLLKAGKLVTSGLVAHYDFEGDSPLKDKFGSEGDIIVSGNSTIVETSAGTKEESILVQKSIANPIIAAKVIKNRIEFWNSYEERGNSGHIEIMKQVPQKDSSEGFSYEFEELLSLYNKGFTGFKTYENNMTYATSLSSMSISECQNNLTGTHYFLAERDSSDPISLNAIKTFSHYIDGGFGTYCIIQRQGDKDNRNAEYSVKKTLLEKVYTSYYCSPWGCKDHKCGYASCVEGFTGQTIKDQDKDIITSMTCLDEKCDISEEYFRYCGSPNGCDESNPMVVQTQEGTCKEASCLGDHILDFNTGQCEKDGCEYIEENGKCLKKLY